MINRQCLHRLALALAVSIIALVAPVKAQQNAVPIGPPFYSGVVSQTIIPYQGSTVYTTSTLSRIYDPSFNGFTNIFQLGSYAKNLSTSPVVAIFGMGEAAGGNAWGGNFVGYASSVTGTAIADETDCGGLISGATAYCKVIVATGGFDAQNAIQIQANSGGALFSDGIKFSSTSRSPVTGSLIIAGSTTAAYGINFSGSTFSASEMLLPSFQVQSTQANTDSVIRIKGGTAGNPVILAVGAGGTPATNASITLTGAGSGGVGIGNGGLYSTSASGGNKGSGAANFATYYANGTAGVTCATGSPTASFSASGGIVTHC